MHTAASNYVYEEFHLWREKYSDLSENCSNLNILEIGSLDINGSVRDFLEPFAGQYIGIDAQKGKGVDLVVDIKNKLKEGYKIKQLKELYPDVKENFFYNIKNGRRWVSL